jgi:hypothetical protein
MIRIGLLAAVLGFASMAASLAVREHFQRALSDAVVFPEPGAATIVPSQEQLGERRRAMKVRDVAGGIAVTSLGLFFIGGALTVAGVLHWGCTSLRPVASVGARPGPHGTGGRR